LSSIIVVALKGMLTQYRDLAKFYRQSTADALLWLATAVAVLVLDVDLGLVIGLALNLALLIWRGGKFQVEEVRRMYCTAKLLRILKLYFCSNVNLLGNIFTLKIMNLFPQFDRLGH